LHKKFKSWTAADEEELARLYPKLPQNELTTRFGIEWNTIKKRAHGKVHRKRSHGGKIWSAEDEAFLKGNYPIMRKEELVSVLQVEWPIIQRRAFNLGIHRRTPWGSKLAYGKKGLRPLTNDDLLHLVLDLRQSPQLIAEEFKVDPNTVYRRMKKVVVPRLIEKQKGLCAICGRKFGGSKLSRYHIDHDHKDTTFRGLICGFCNFGLGFFFDSIEKLRGAIQYLEANASPGEILIRN